MCILSQQKAQSWVSAPRRCSTVINYLISGIILVNPSLGDGRFSPEQTWPIYQHSLILLFEDYVQLATMFLPFSCFTIHVSQKPLQEVVNCFLPVTRKTASYYASQSKVRNNSNKRLLLRLRLGGGGKEMIIHLTMIRQSQI